MDQDTQRARYFSCSALNGRLYVHEISTGSEGASHTSYRSREDVDKISTRRETASFIRSRTSKTCSGHRPHDLFPSAHSSPLRGWKKKSAGEVEPA